MTLTGLAFLISFAYGMLSALGRHPIYGLTTYIAVLFLHPPSRWWGASLPGGRWALVASLVTFFAYQSRSSLLMKPTKIRSHSIFMALSILFVWMVIQWPWALWTAKHGEIVELYFKYLILMYLFYHVVSTDRHLRMILWTYIFGCFYLGWIAYTTYTGGRFEGFGGPDTGEANAGALALVLGVFAVAPIFLTGTLTERLLLMGAVPFIMNGIITTASRSAFLALSIGGLIYLYFSPKRYRGRIVLLGALGVVAFVVLANDFFWGRMGSLKHAGSDVAVEITEGGRKVSAGFGRVVLMEAQMQMFLTNPLGHGHRGTAALSSQYLDERFLTGAADTNRARSSHSTFFTLMVEHGVVGIAVYFAMLWWCFFTLRRASRICRNGTPFQSALLPSLAAGLAATFVGDCFVDYLKFEPRIWFIVMLMILVDGTKLTGNGALTTSRGVR